jgi:segregation and condensation protein B
MSENKEIGIGLNEELALEEVTVNEEGVSAEEGASEEAAAGASTAGILEVVEDQLPTELSQVEAQSIIESLFFASPHPLSVKIISSVFHGTNIDSDKIKHIINLLQTDFAGGDRGISLEEVGGGYQIRTKLDNAPWIKRMSKTRTFKLSGPALEVLSIVAYKQPVIKSEVDQIRGVESGHLVRALMERNLIKFSGKSELPGKPMLYATTKEFLELFGLRNIRELPTLSEIDELIPEGIGANEDLTGLENETLGTLSEKIGLPMGKSYSESESELLSITDELTSISSSTEFFEQEKQREKERREAEKAQDLKERKIVGETLTPEEERWLSRFEAKMLAKTVSEANVASAAAEAAAVAASTEETPVMSEAPLASEIPTQEA